MILYPDFRYIANNATCSSTTKSYQYQYVYTALMIIEIEFRVCIKAYNKTELRN